MDEIPDSEWVDLRRFDDKENKTTSDTPLLVNIKGCGYPPAIDCVAFTIKYDNISEAGETFPCHFSRANNWVVLEKYNFGDTLGNVLSSIGIPNGIFFVSLVVLLYWYCPYCQARCRRYEEQNDFDGVDKDHALDMEDDEDEPREYDGLTL